MGKKYLHLILEEEVGNELKKRLKSVDENHPLYAFAIECIEKFDKKMKMKDELYSPEERPHFCSTVFRVEYDESLKKLLLSEEATKVFGEEIAKQFVYRFTGIYPKAEG